MLPIVATANPWPGDTGGLGRIFNTGNDVLDAIGNGYAQLRYLRLQEDLISAQARQSALLATPAVESNPGAVPAPVYVPTGFADPSASLGGLSPAVVLVGAAVLALALLAK